NVRIDYAQPASGGIGFAGRTGGPAAIITVRLQNLPIQFFFLGGLMGFLNLNMPPFIITGNTEDLCSSGSGRFPPHRPVPTYFLSAGHGPERTRILERRIREVIPDLALIASLEDFARHRSAQPNEPIQVLVAAPPGDNGYFDRLVDVASRHRDRAFFILI